MSLKQPLAPRVTLTGQVLESVLDAIMSGEIAAGEPINEADIARRLGVSRGPLREALNRLEGRQLLERTPGAGLRVIRLSRADLVSLFEIRSVLEGLACRRAATLISDQELDKLEALVEEQSRRAKSRNRSDTYSNDDDFHLLIARASRSDRLIKMLTEDLYLQIRLYRYQSERRSAQRAMTAHQEHQEVVAALRARDPDRAALAMSQHIDNAMAALLASAGSSLERAAQAATATGLA